MNVIYYSSDFFSQICGVAIESLCEHNLDIHEISIYLVEDHIASENKARLKSITDRFNRSIYFIKMPTQKEVFPNVKINLGRTYCRMVLGELLPQNVDRVLSLDSDTLVMNSLKEMYNTDLGENYVAGVYDCVGEAIQKKVLQAVDELQYCNAGMFLVDLNAWRREKLGDKLLEAVLNTTQQNKGKMYFLEQDLMNLVFEGHLKLLHPRYNLLTSIYLFDYSEVLKMKRPVRYYTKELVKEAKEIPALLHATTCFYVRKRMWVENSDHPYAFFYQAYRSRTPWSNEPQIQDERKKLKKIYGQFWHCMPRSCAIWIATLVINYVRPAYAWITTKASLPTIAEQSST